MEGVPPPAPRRAKPVGDPPPRRRFALVRCAFACSLRFVGAVSNQRDSVQPSSRVRNDDAALEGRRLLKKRGLGRPKPAQSARGPQSGVLAPLMISMLLLPSSLAT